MLVMTFNALMSTAAVVSEPVLATYSVPLGENVSQFGRMPVRTPPINLKSGRVYPQTDSVTSLAHQTLFPSGATAKPCEGVPPISATAPRFGFGGLILWTSFR